MEKEKLEIQNKEKLVAGIGRTDGTMKPLGETVLDFFGVITKWRRFIVWLVLSATIITTIVTLLFPKWYKATASVFPAEQTNLFSQLEGLSSIVRTFSPGSGLASLTRPSEAERYIAILKSENALMKVIEKFDLTKVYDITKYPREKTIKELLSNVNFEIADEGYLGISVYDKDPNRSAAMANYFVQILNEINAQLNAQNAKGNREFIEQRYNKNLTDLRQAEDALKSFQLKRGIIAMPEQTEASIKAAAEIYGKLAASEIELNVLRRTLSDDHPSIVEKEIEIDAVRSKLREMSIGSKSAPDEMKILVPFRQVPDLAAEYIRLYREVEIQYKILQFITPLYEQAKIEEKRSTPSVVVLDEATVPERKAKPKISLYALLAFVISTIVSMFIVLIAESVARLRTIDPDRFNLLWITLRSDWFGLRQRRDTQ